MDKILGGVDAVQAGENELAAEKIEAHTYGGGGGAGEKIVSPPSHAETVPTGTVEL